MLMYVILFVLLVGVLSTWRSGFTTPLLLLTLICYLAMIAVVIETTARFRDKDIRNTCYWIKFFKVFPLNEPIGLILGLLAIANLILIVILANASLIINQYLTAYSVFQIFATFTLIAFTYFGQLLLELASQYERANEDRIRSERFKVELITNVSHDIRTPLTSIISYVDLLKGLPNEDEEFRDYVDVLDRKSMRLKVLIDDLMEASKASTGNLAVSFEYVDLVELVGQIAGEFDDRFTELNLVLVTDDSEQPRMIKADSKHVWRILENLFGNVVKYALPGTRVFAEITIEHDQTAFYDNVVLSIKNTSRLPLEQKGDELMQQFIRGDRARQTEGSGLGLYIAKNLSELMGGSLEIRISGDLFETLVRFKRKP
ncbi:MAG TPA: sensor histidine kinase [Coriobacteriia bacterium]|nr:sensor histidine kinase [Coriobacteriia bacterium]